MLKYCGLNQNPFSNGISYEAFRKGFYLAGRTLSEKLIKLKSALGRGGGT